MTIMLIPFSQGWDGNCIVQFMNVISPVGNESGCWVASPPLDDKFGLSAEPAPKASWYPPHLGQLLPSTPNY